MYRKFLPVVLLMSALLLAPSILYAAPTQSVVVVDLYRAFTQTKQGKAVLDRLEKEFKSKQGAIEKKQKDLLVWKETKNTVRGSVRWRRSFFLERFYA